MSLRLESRDITDVRRILAKIALAADRRPILERARQVNERGENSVEASPTETLALHMFAAREARNRFLPNSLDEAAWDVLVAVYLDDPTGLRQTIGRFLDLSGTCRPRP